MSNREYHLSLISLYIFSNTFYSMSLQTRVCYDLGYICFNISRYNKELDALSDKELEEKLSSITKPQWYDKYEYIEKRNKRLLKILYYFPTPKVVNFLYEILKQNEHNMNKGEGFSHIYHRPLVFTYIQKRLKYPLSFKQRVEFNLGIVNYFPDTDGKEFDALSDKELKSMIHSLKAPWWNGMYETFLEDHTLLLVIVWFLLNPRVFLRILKHKDLLQ